MHGAAYLLKEISQGWGVGYIRGGAGFLLSPPLLHLHLSARNQIHVEDEQQPTQSQLYNSNITSPQYYNKRIQNLIAIVRVEANMLARFRRYAEFLFPSDIQITNLRTVHAYVKTG